MRTTRNDLFAVYTQPRWYGGLLKWEVIRLGQRTGSRTLVSVCRNRKSAQSRATRELNRLNAIFTQER